jgi:hypothetical protein
MKQTLLKALIFMIAFVFFQSFSFGQLTKTITVQFNKDKLTGGKVRDRSTSHKDFLIRVEGINTALHKVVIKYDDFNWFTETPEALKAILPGIKIDGLGVTKDTTTKENANTSMSDIVFYINKAMQTIKMFKDSTEKIYSNSNDSIHCLDIKKIAHTDSAQVADLEMYMSWFSGYYESLLKMSESAYDEELAHKLGEFKNIYETLQAHKKSLINGANVIIAANKKAPIGFFPSKVHSFSKQAATAKIYVINNFDLSDTLATYKEDIYKAGKFSFDFSTGVALNNLVKPQYYIGDNGSGKFIGNEQTRPLDFSVVALLHLNVRVCSWLSIGPATGVSVSAFDANTGYIYGGSISFGKNQSFSITAGGILGKTVALSKKVSSNGTEADLPLPADISSVPTYDKIGTGGFISFTYNLTRIRR